MDRDMDDQNAPVRAKAVLVDPETFAVLWTNELVADDGSGVAVTVDDVVPMARSMGVPEALRVVADTGVAQHLATDLVSTSRGSMALSVSIHRLPDGELLILMDHTWRPAKSVPGGKAARRGRR